MHGRSHARLDAGLADAGAPLPRPCRALSSGRARSSAAPVEGGIHRTDYAEIRGRALKLAGALPGAASKRGDRVATLAWNTHRHIEAWYGIAGAGAVYHTLNPRLFPDSDRLDRQSWRRADADVRQLLRADRGADRAAIETCRDLCRAWATRRAAQNQAAGKLIAYEELIKGKEGRWAEVDENDACGLCYTSGTTGDPKGVLYSHRSNVLHALMAGQSPGLGLGAGGRDAAGGAHVPCQWLGDSLSGAR